MALPGTTDSTVSGKYLKLKGAFLIARSVTWKKRKVYDSESMGMGGDLWTKVYLIFQLYVGGI